MPGTSTIKSISVDIEVLTKDRLRKVVFGLDKTTSDAGEPTWTINFELFERAKKDEEFGDAIVSLDAVVVKKANVQQAEETATAGGLTKPQADHALGPGAVDAKRFKEGKISREKAEATVQRILAKRA